ncbi:MAG: nodulation protein NfeD [Prolixibacteraceae bacterium]|jgi:membrane-bound serine protease (ClpP class)|nr:nodulation protein NfeD [Prolixibacteraceae bacterium]
MKRILLFLAALLISISAIKAEENDTLLIYKFNIKEEIAPSIWRQTKIVFDNARKMNADLIIIHMNTYGGTVVDADSIRTRIINSNIPVWTFIDNNAASAGALISIACDSVFMRPGANIGAATVVNQGGQKAPDKYQSYFRATMRSTAESHGADTIITANDTIIKWFRDPKIAEAMVDEDVYIPGIIDTGKVLTFTTNEAIKFRFCEGKADNINDLLEKANVKHYIIQEYTPTTIDKIIGFLAKPMISGLLIMAIIGGIYFEMQSPGLGFPIAISILAAIAYFMPLYLEGLAENWEIIIFVVGLILIAVEVFIIPGFGVAGALGISLTIAGLTLSLIENVRFNFERVDGSSIMIALLTVVVSMFIGLLLALWGSRKLFTASNGALSSLALNTSQNKTEGFISYDNVHQSEMIGKKGIAQTILRPSGKVTVENEYWDAKAEYGYIDKGDPIVVLGQESGQLYVEKDEE